MTLITLPYRTQLAAGQPEDISMVLADLDAILAVVNGDIRNDNINSSAAIAATKLNIPANIKQVLRGDGTWGVHKAVGAFRAKRTTTQSIAASTYTKIQYNSEDFDTDSWYDPTTNFRYQPNLAGYVFLNAQFYMQTAADKQIYCAIYKNGALYQEGGINQSDGSDTLTPQVSCIAACNGSSDFFEAYAWQDDAVSHNIAASAAPSDNAFSGFMIGLS